MRFNDTTVRILVRKDYGACYDFYTEKMGSFRYGVIGTAHTPLSPLKTGNRRASPSLREPT